MLLNDIVEVSVDGQWIYGIIRRIDKKAYLVELNDLNNPQWFFESEVKNA